MADKYCDHGLYGAYAATPTWGAAQDGDGTAIGEATPSTAEVVFTGIPSAGTIAVLGITLSPTWATSADVCANNLATAINASTSTATSPASFTVKSQVRNHVYARGPADGAPAGTCQIMTRQASAAHAGLIAVTHTLNNVSSAGTINFAGGTGGAWGWLFNPVSTIWPSAVAACGYGLWAAIQPYTGSQVSGDAVHIRANNKIVALGVSGATIPLASTAGTDSNNPVRCIIGDPSIWTSDASTSTLTISSGSTGGQISSVRIGAAPAYHISGRELSTDNYNLKFEMATGSSGVFEIWGGNNSKLENVNMPSPTGALAWCTLVVNQQTLGRRSVFKKIHIKSSHTQPFFGVANGGNPYSCDFYDITLDATGATVINPGILGTLKDCWGEILMENLVCTGFVTGSKLFPAAINNALRITLTNPSFGGVTDRGPYLPAATNTGADYAACVAVFTQDGKRDFLVENQRGLVQWNSGVSQPTLSATLLDGSPWSWLILPTTTAAKISIQNPLISGRIVKINSLATGQRTITLQLCISDQVTFTKKSIALEVVYTDVNGKRVSISSFDILGGALSASTVTWSQEVGGKVTYSSGGTLYHNKYAISLTTPTGKDIPLGAEIGAYVSVHTNVANNTQFIFVDPDVSIV